MRRIGVRWVIGTLIIAVLAGGMVRLGLWQLDRLHGRQDVNARIEQKLAEAPVKISSEGIPAGLEGFTPVEVTGQWEPSLIVYLRYPIRDGQQGYEVLEPLRVGDGLILVDRGWIPQEAGRTAQRGDPSIPGQTVTVKGLLRDSEITDAEIGVNEAQPGVPTVTKVDIPRIQTLMGGDLTGKKKLASQWVQLKEPAAEGDPLPVYGPSLDEGSHFSYALQWFSFAAIAVFGWLALLAHTFMPEGVLWRKRFEDEMFSDIPPEMKPGHRRADAEDERFI